LNLKNKKTISLSGEFLIKTWYGDERFVGFVKPKVLGKLKKDCSARKKKAFYCQNK